MTEIILVFPVPTASLYCVWFETGNPAQPLACRWVTSEEAVAASSSVSAGNSEICQICA